MIKEYEKIKVFINEFLLKDNNIIINDIFTNEYNAFEIRIKDIIFLSDKEIRKFIFKIQNKFDDVIYAYDKIENLTLDEILIIIYLKKIEQIRNKKIKKIKYKLTLL